MTSDQLVAPHRGDEGEADARVAARRLNQYGLARMNLSGTFGFDESC